MFWFLIFSISLYFSCVIPNLTNIEVIQQLQDSVTTSRKLQDLGKPLRDSKRTRNKLERAAKIIAVIKGRPVPVYFKPDSGSPSHNPNGPAVFAVAMNVDFIRYFAKTVNVEELDASLHSQCIGKMQ